jgi:carbon-monoxide dehydrogenase medium subunit
VLPAAELVRGPLLTALDPDELIIETRWPLPPAGAGWGFHEVARRHGDFALMGAAAVVTLGGRRVTAARIAVFGSGPGPQRARPAEAALMGGEPTPALIEEAAGAGAAAIETHDDLHAPAAYRARVARTLIARALTDAATRAGQAR